MAAERHEAALVDDAEHNVFICTVDPKTGAIMHSRQCPWNGSIDCVDDSTPAVKDHRAFAQNVLDAFKG